MKNPDKSTRKPWKKPEITFVTPINHTQGGVSRDAPAENARYTLS